MRVLCSIWCSNLHPGDGSFAYPSRYSAHATICFIVTVVWTWSELTISFELYSTRPRLRLMLFIRYLAGHGTDKWKFNPPTAPNFGGLLWEAAVRFEKHHFRRVLRDSSLTYEEMTTFLPQIEACLNSTRYLMTQIIPNSTTHPSSFSDWQFSSYHTRTFCHRLEPTFNWTLEFYKTHVRGCMAPMACWLSPWASDSAEVAKAITLCHD